MGMTSLQKSDWAIKNFHSEVMGYLAFRDPNDHSEKYDPLDENIRPLQSNADKCTCTCTAVTSIIASDFYCKLTKLPHFSNSVLS